MQGTYYRITGKQTEDVEVKSQPSHSLGWDFQRVGAERSYGEAPKHVSICRHVSLSITRNMHVRHQKRKITTKHPPLTAASTPPPNQRPSNENKAGEREEGVDGTLK